MKLRLGVAVLAASLACGSAHATTFTSLYAFGDSLSDAGNLAIFAAANPGLGIPLPPSPPYSPGHASNGPTWVEDLSVKLGLGTLTPSLAGGNDYAFAGARATTNRPIDLSSQVSAFTGATHSGSLSTALFTLDIGANDIFRALSSPSTLASAVSTAITDTLAAITTLFGDGARNLLFYDVPSLSLTPVLNSGPAFLKNAADTAAQTFNAGVLAGLTTLEGDGLKVYNLDDLLNGFVSNPSSFDFANVTDACVATPACVGGTFDQQNDYLFWDGVHPTAEGHMVTANFAVAALGGVPEPSTWTMMLLGFAGLGFAGYRKTRRARAA